mgnify:CR=1 FL=1
MTESEINKEAAKFFPPQRYPFGLAFSQDDVVAFAQHCVEKSNGWIPLTESMPEPMVQVLMWDGAHVFVEQWWGEGYLLDHRITRWKPLPPAPEAA